jgi:hypothetical protein
MPSREDHCDAAREDVRFMTVRATLCSEVVKGLSFEIEEHLVIKDWATRNDHRAVVHLNHRAEGEDYEEAIMLLFGRGDRCRFIMWRSPQAVVVQPLIGRGRRYESVQAAVEGPLLNRVMSEYRHAGTRGFADA